MPCSCQNCDWTGEESQVRPLPEEGLTERVLPGEPMPVGECPECGAVCHELKTFLFSGPEGESYEVEEINEAYAALQVLHRLGWGQAGDSDLRNEGAERG